jgi:hypothetical protein
MAPFDSPGDPPEAPGPAHAPPRRRPRSVDRQVLSEMVRRAERHVEVLDAHLSEDFLRAVTSGDRDGVAYLLWVGVTPRACASAHAYQTVMQAALFNCDLEMAKLLCAHHASLMPVSQDEANAGALFDPPRSIAQTATHLRSWLENNLHAFDPANGHLGDRHPLLQWMSARPRGTAPVACDFHKRLIKANAHWHYARNSHPTVAELSDARTDPDFDVTLVDVARQWPPRGRMQWPPPASIADGTLRPATHLDMLEYWSRIRRLRRAEAAYAAKGHWATLRSFARLTLPMALHWQGRTQERLCAPGGLGRKRDLDAFREDGF